MEMFWFEFEAPTSMGLDFGTDVREKAQCGRGTRALLILRNEPSLLYTVGDIPPTISDIHAMLLHSKIIHPSLLFNTRQAPPPTRNSNPRILLRPLLIRHPRIPLLTLLRKYIRVVHAQRDLCLRLDETRALSPATRCHAMWQCTNHAPGLSSLKAIGEVAVVGQDGNVAARGVLEVERRLAAVEDACRLGEDPEVMPVEVDGVEEMLGAGVSLVEVGGAGMRELRRRGRGARTRSRLDPGLRGRPIRLHLLSSIKAVSLGIPLDNTRERGGELTLTETTL